MNDQVAAMLSSHEAIYFTSSTTQHTFGMFEPYDDPYVGALRFNSSLQCYEVFDGVAWQMHNRETVLNLDEEFVDLIEWAKRKKQEDEQLYKLLEENEGLKEIYGQFKTMKALLSNP